MKSVRILVIAVLISLGAVWALETQSPEPMVYHVYFLAGQSNMEGYGYNRDLPETLRAPQAGVRIFHGKIAKDGEAGGGVGYWAGLTPGHGTGFDTDGAKNSLSDRFGPEISFGHAMAAARSGEKIAIIKYARGGTSLMDGVSDAGSWDPDFADGNGLNQYDHALATIRNALAAADIDNDGVSDQLVPAGIIWMQGETDAQNNEAAAANYAQNLSRLMGLFRTALGDEDLPVVIGRIQDSGHTPETRVMVYAAEVQAAQAAFAAADRCAAMTRVTEAFSFPNDRWHYGSADYVTLGAAFAREILALRDRCGR